MTSVRISVTLLVGSLAAGAGVGAGTRTAAAQPLDPTKLPLVEAALAEQAPMLVSPAGFTVEDYRLEFAPGAPVGLRAWLEPGSLHWVWAQGRFAVPRAILVVEAAGATAGSVEHGSFTHALAAADGGVRARIPVALLSGAVGRVTVRTDRGTAVLTSRFHHAGVVLFDSSCSSWGLHVADGDPPPDSWMYVRCHVTPTLAADGRTGAVSLFVLWDNPGDDVELEGAAMEAQAAPVYHVKLVSAPSRVRLSARGHTVSLGHRVPPRLAAGFVGVGVGPYLYSYDDFENDVETVAPIITIYAGYAFEPDLRLVYFNATALNRWFFSDHGLYLWVEQLRALDDRMSVNLLLGLHVMMFENDDDLRVRVSAPQGIELVYRDLFATNRNFSAGGFIYPEISDRSYFNVWIRWGSPSLFGELNWIAWKEPIGDGETESQSLGLTLGFPLFRFL